MKTITSLHIIQYPNGRYGYVGNVPASIGYVDATPEKMEAAKFGSRFGPKKRTFETRKEAVDFALDHGYKVN